MIQSKLREMTAAERRRFETMQRRVDKLFELKTFGQWLGAFLIFLFFALLGFAGATIIALVFYFLGKMFSPLAVFGSPAAVRIWQPLGAVVGLLGIPFCFQWMTQKARSTHMKKLALDLSKGLVEVLSVESEVAAKQETVDGTAAFFVQVLPGKALFLQGEYLEDAVHAENFPNTLFDVVRGPESKIILELKCFGKNYDAMAVLPDPGLNQLPLDGEIVSKVIRKK